MKNYFKLFVYFACLVALLFGVSESQKIISMPKSYETPFSLAIILIISVGMIIVGIIDLREYESKLRTPKKRKNWKQKFLSTEFTPPMVTLSYGQIMGGIIGVIFTAIWVVTRGVR